MMILIVSNNFKNFDILTLETSRSFADIVRAIENVNFITPVEKFGRNSNRNATS